MMQCQLKAKQQPPIANLAKTQPPQWGSNSCRSCREIRAPGSRGPAEGIMLLKSRLWQTAMDSLPWHEAPAAGAQRSGSVSLHFVAQGEVCTGANIAALQQLGSQVSACLITTKNEIILSGDRGINQPYCVNISQYIHTSNHHILHLKLTILYANYISIKLVGKGCYKY